jgi:hypothetical protein
LIHINAGKPGFCNNQLCDAKPRSLHPSILHLCSSARAEVLYVRPDDGLLTAQYLWHGQVIRDPISVRNAIGIAKTTNGSRPIEIRLLRQEGADETFYSIDLSSYRSA